MVPDAVGRRQGGLEAPPSLHPPEPVLAQVGHPAPQPTMKPEPTQSNRGGFHDTAGFGDRWPAEGAGAFCRGLADQHGGVTRPCARPAAIWLRGAGVPEQHEAEPPLTECSPPPNPLAPPPPPSEEEEEEEEEAPLA